MDKRLTNTFPPRRNIYLHDWFGNIHLKFVHRIIQSFIQQLYIEKLQVKHHCELEVILLKQQIRFLFTYIFLSRGQERH